MNEWKNKQMDNSNLGCDNNYSIYILFSLSNKKILNLTNLKAFAEKISNVAETIISVLDKTNNVHYEKQTKCCLPAANYLRVIET